MDTTTSTIVDSVAVGDAPYSVVIEPGGAHAYVTNASSDTVSILDTATNTVTETMPVGDRPLDVALAPDGVRAYVTNFNANTVSVIDTATNTVVATIAVGDGAAGVTVAGHGARAYVTNFNANTVSVIDTATNMVTETITVGDRPQGIAIAQLPPEPAPPLPPVREIADHACPPDQVPEDGFTDVAAGAVHEEAIDCIAWYAITRGTTASTYSPGTSVTRGQMASFIARLIDFAGEPIHARISGPGTSLPEATNPQPFPCDVGLDHPHGTAIARLAGVGIVVGGPGGIDPSCFGPDLAVSRAQMAAFIARAYDFITGTGLPASSGDCFVDDDTSVHEGVIDTIAEAGITNGTGDDASGQHLYSPGEPVRRDQMASFLARTLDILVDDSLIVPPA